VSGGERVQREAFAAGQHRRAPIFAVVRLPAAAAAGLLLLLPEEGAEVVPDELHAAGRRRGDGGASSIRRWRLRVFSPASDLIITFS
jgi:hypothetical protein